MFETRDLSARILTSVEDKALFGQVKLVGRLVG